MNSLTFGLLLACTAVLADPSPNPRSQPGPRALPGPYPRSAAAPYPSQHSPVGGPSPKAKPHLPQSGPSAGPDADPYRLYRGSLNGCGYGCGCGCGYGLPGSIIAGSPGLGLGLFDYGVDGVVLV
ncbi:translation initiation factor IF-2-like [Homalodisca vitripennis]|uniref:translation initiation factor IF-2-like n=1 Tax=Homalodisca vitripennis TaxID=197043 RepID=UPI001EEB95AC|nr:translation initiation factor IF-2-like [Homalodisca vitripennis]KAG8242169.1 hypothetical protein J6590_071026 [Homalodisca vitripennis]